MSDVTDLKAEVLLLRKERTELMDENERLRKAKDTMRGDAFEIGAMLVKARAENAKLRELVRYMWDFSCVVPDEPHTSKEELDYSVEVWKRMRKLGIEVD